MDLTLNKIKQLADLSKLKFNEDELNELYDQIKKIVDFKYIVKLSSLDLDDAPICINPIPIENFMRDDTVLNEFKLEDALLNAPERIEEYFVVPRIVE
ncbi:MAG: Asp-tRNA(Asn)/Glu-tRNA(Gln) amidotransferase subunit GatC [Oscillospiraceae bacterium]|nr:Asp-tRNA(Asn)/Glu-tRNA(Gln) amidotransferase subunit GatC [Oscillospiraceae bacterium]